MNPLAKLSIGVLVITLLASCNEDLEQNDPGSNLPVVLQFGDDLSVPENSESKEITLSLSKAAPYNGQVSIKVTSDVPDAFQTEPATQDDHIEMFISKGATEVSFDVTPVNDESPNENVTIEFELADISQGFEIGQKAKTTVTIVDDDLPGEPQFVTANFAVTSGKLIENQLEGLEIKITLSGTVAENGKLVIHKTGSQNDLYYYTVPALDANDNLTFIVEPGATELTFKVIPINDEVLKSHQLLVFDIADADGSIIKGNQLTYSLNLLDKELVGKPKSYDSHGGGWRVKYTYNYNSLGQVSFIEWENFTPGHRSGSYTYYYAENGLVERISYHPSRDEYFYQENGRIVRSEVIAYGDVVSYSFYDYDPAGNVGARLNYVKNAKGEFVKDLLYLYLYFDNGNIYKQLTYIPGEEEGEEQLISTRTFDGYYPDKINHFPMFEVIHGIKSQPGLPTYHRVEENGADLQYNLSYEFDEDGNAKSRTVTGSGANEITYYEYY